jgi:hypothetical protein
MDDDGSEVIGMSRARPKLGLNPSVISKLLEDDTDLETTPELREWMAKSQPRLRDDQTGRDRKKEEPEAAHETMPESPEQHTSLPAPGSPYHEAYLRIGNRPLSTIFFLTEGDLPHGFAYHNLEEVWMAEPKKPGASPDLMVRFNGSVVKEVRIEGRNLLPLCEWIGRHLILWLRTHPTGTDDRAGAVFIKRITITKVEK